MDGRLQKYLHCVPPHRKFRSSYFIWVGAQRNWLLQIVPEKLVGHTHAAETMHHFAAMAAGAIAQRTYGLRIVVYHVHAVLDSQYLVPAVDAFVAPEARSTFVVAYA